MEKEFQDLIRVYEREGKRVSLEIWREEKGWKVEVVGWVEEEGEMKGELLKSGEGRTLRGAVGELRRK